jgi:energy-coupling factor transporter ATP-binding protein EcfA2
MPYDILIGRDESDKKRFGDKGLVYIGKQYVKMGTLTSLSNRMLMDIARSHIVLIAGKRGSGKSYTLSVIAEELSLLPEETAKNIASLIFDTMGIFWTMKYANEKEYELLREWQLEPKKLPVKIFVPFGFEEDYKSKGLPVDSVFALSANELGADDWCITFGLEITDAVAILIQHIIALLQEQDTEFSIDEIIDEVKKDKESGVDTKQAVINLFQAAKTWGIFAEKNKKSTSIRELVEGGRTTVLDLSCYSSVGAFNVRALVISLVSRKLFTERMAARKAEEVQAVQHGIEYLHYKEKREMPLVWLFIDEAHEFLPKRGKTAATDTLIQILREGRQPGISLVMATQQPGAIHQDVMTQSDIIIAHRVTAKPDVEALNIIMQTYLLEDIKAYMNNLPDLKGSAIVLDDNSERINPMRVRARFTWHGGEAPTAIRVERRL